MTLYALLILAMLASAGSPSLAQPRLFCGQPIAGQLGAGDVDAYRLKQAPEDRVVVEAVDTSGNLGLLRLRALVVDGAHETITGSLPLKNAIGLVSVSDWIPNLTADQVGQYTVAMSVVSNSLGNCGQPLVCGASVAAVATVPGEVDNYTFPGFIAGEVVTVRVLTAAANKYAMRLRVFGPDGRPVLPVAGTPECDPVMTVTLPERGLYTLLVSACAKPRTGAYAVSFEPPACPVAMTIGNVVSSVDQPASFRVLLHTAGQSVVALQNDIEFDPAAPIGVTPGGGPACQVNPNINKPDTTFAFQPAGCTAGLDCTGMRATVFANDNADAIADGAELYACLVHPTATAVVGHAYPLTCGNLSVNSTAVQPVPVFCSDGAIEVGPPACAGDCGRDGQVTLDELLTGIGIALGSLPVSQCSAFDTDADGTVTIDEVVNAVHNALIGCLASPTAVPAVGAVASLGAPPR